MAALAEQHPQQTWEVTHVGGCQFAANLLVLPSGLLYGALGPDTGLEVAVRHEDLYGELNAIAPTVLAPDLGDTWKQNFLLCAEALGKTDEAKQMLTEFEQRAAKGGQQIGEGKTLSITRFLPGQIRLYSDKSFTGTILTDMGLEVPEAARGADTYLEISREQVDLVDADHLYVSTYGDPADTDRDRVTGGPLWSNLTAVQQGELFELNDDLLSGIGIQAAQALLDRFEEDLT